MKVVLITGASSGIGYATALAFAKRGASVVAIARRVERLAQLEREIADLPGDCLAIAADVTDHDAMDQAVAQAVERFGRLDVLVANAGVGQRAALVDSSWGDLETLLRTNIDGVIHGVRAAVPAMRSTGGEPLGEPLGGHIVIVSSVASETATPYAAAYGASKAFVSSLARSLSLELEADHITVTNLIVGVTASEFQQNRLGERGVAAGAANIPAMQPSEVADGIVRATDRRAKTAILRPFDRLVLWANRIAPGWIGRQALRRYKTD